MASIRKRGRDCYVQIGKNGYQTLTHTLSSLSLARKGTAGVEPIWSGIYRAAVSYTHLTLPTKA